MPPPLNSSWMPPDSAEVLFLERANLNGVIISAVAYGILFTLSISCFQGLWARKRDRRVTWFLTTYVFLIIGLATAGLGARIKFNQMTFIDYRNIPGGPNVFIRVFSALSVNLGTYVCFSVLIGVSDGMLLYRFFVIYGRSYLYAIGPAILYVAGVAVTLALLVAFTKLDDTLWAPVAVKLGIASWILTVSMNLIFTLLISIKLLIARRNIRAIDPTHDDQYLSVVTVLVESASLYSAWALAFVITYATDSPVQSILGASIGHISGIAALLILLRVINGQAWDNNTSENLRLSFRDASRLTAGGSSTHSEGVVPLGAIVRGNVVIEQTITSLHDHDGHSLERKL